MTNNSLSYRDAGVNIDQADALVSDIKQIAKTTARPGILAGIGGFGALFEIPLDRYREPVLVSGTDGVGTKLKLALAQNKHDTIGVDLVAMCANDIICQGAEPLFFLDYYASGKLLPEQAKAVLSGIGEGCRQAGAALIGGETAELPGMYYDGDYDLAGFCVGIVEKSKIIDGPKNIKPNDVLIGLASSGPHSNGYSLIRRVIERSQTSLDQNFHGQPLADCLLTPTKMYVKSLLTLLAKTTVHGLVHITGGGLLDNIPRVLPPQMQAVIDTTQWQSPPIFEWLQHEGQIDTQEMYRTFNNGIGMVVIVPETTANQAVQILQANGEQATIIGAIQTCNTADPAVVLNGC